MVNLDMEGMIEGMTTTMERLFGNSRRAATGGAAERAVADPFARQMRAGAGALPGVGDEYQKLLQRALSGEVPADPFAQQWRSASSDASTTGGAADPFAQLKLGASASDGGGLVGSSPANPFAGLADALTWKREREAKTAATPATPLGPSASAGGSGSWGNHEPYRPLIEKYAAQYGLDPDAVAAYLRIETPSGDPNLTSHAGAMGLAQVMPFHFQPGENPYDPETNLRVGIGYFAAMYKQFGDYGLAAAAYHGGPGAIRNGQPRDDNSDGNVTSAGYAKMWRDYYAQIKSTAPKQPATVAGNASLASLFGGSAHGITQEFGRTRFSTGEGAGIYDFGVEFGLDGDSHSGLDIGTPNGTRLFMPAGLSGVVTIAGGSGYYTDESGKVDPRTSGEIRITLSNGMELILGHNSQINVKQGQQVNAGDLLGLTGWTTGGAHLHLELRQRDPSTRSGWRIIDPRVLFGGG